MKRLPDAALGAIVLLGLGGLAWLATRADRPIVAEGPMLAALGSPEDRGTPLPTFDAPCDGTWLLASPDTPDPSFAKAALVVCHLEGGASIGLRLDQITDHPAAGVYAFPGNVRVGGPLAPAQGVLLYPDGESARWTTSHRRARELSRTALLDGLLGRAPAPDAKVPTLVFGHVGWAEGQLEAEIAAGHWVVLDAPPDLSP